MSVEGYYGSVDLLAPQILRRHYEMWGNEEEFLAKSLNCFNAETGAINAYPVLNDECAIWSNSLNCVVKAYEHNNIQVIYTDTLFTKEDFTKFETMYKDSFFDGIRPALATRKEFLLEDYIYGIIDLSVKTKKVQDGQLVLNFSEFGKDCLNILYCAKTMYTVPIAGLFKHIDVNEEEISLIFYV